MKNTLLIATGGAIGFVLGARAGRPTYDRIVQNWSGMANASGLGKLAATVKDAGVDVRDTAVTRASDAVSSAADGISKTTGTHQEPSYTGPASTEPMYDEPTHVFTSTQS